jgi:hypothetical protein
MKTKTNTCVVRQLICAILFFISITAQASTPLWTFTPLTATTITVPSNGTATISYTVTNQSNKSHTLKMTPIQGITQLTSGAGICASTFTLATKGSSCILSLQVNGSEMTNTISNGPIVCEQGSSAQCYRPGTNDILHITFGGPVSAPTLSNVSPSSGTRAGGVGVTLTGTNLSGATAATFGGIAATSINVINATTVAAVTPAHPAGIVDVAVTTPGGTATLLNGFTYLNETIGQPSGGGIIGCEGIGPQQNLIAATVNNSNGTIWGSYPPQTNAISDTDGAANTTTIVSTLGAGTNYAAGICDAYELDSQGNTPCVAGNACYNDWFLPAKDQLNCFYTNKDAIGNFDNNGYWSSTEDPPDGAWYQEFFGGIQNTVLKSNPSTRVRCAREFTP